jgi:hypothetical protein
MARGHSLRFSESTGLLDMTTATDTRIDALAELLDR